MTHDVKVEKSPVLELKSKDMVIAVQKDGELLGRLYISKGAIEWRSANNWYYRKMRWTKFAEMMMEKGWRRRKEKK